MAKFSNFTNDLLFKAIKDGLGNLKKASELLGMSFSKSDARALSLELTKRGIQKPTSEDRRNYLEEKYLKSPKLCKYCGKPLDYNHRNNTFCSLKCSTTYLNLHTIRSEGKFSKEQSESIINTVRDTKYCLNCGKKLNSHLFKYCSCKCQRDFEYEEYLNKWKNGEEFGLVGEYGLSRRIRRYLIEKHDCKCELCGWGQENPYTHTIPLEIHHKDGNYLNNSEENLQVLCPNCHSLTETFKSHNKNGRKGRAKYTE